MHWYTSRGSDCNYLSYTLRGTVTSLFQLRDARTFRHVYLIVVGRLHTFKHSRDHDCITASVGSTTDVRISRGSECGYGETGFVCVFVGMYAC